MKQLKSHDPERQQLWQYEGRTYSIIDVTLAPLESDSTRMGGDFTQGFRDILIEALGSADFELADAIGGRAEVLGRFESFEAAQQGITELAAHAPRKPQT
jgi:hypothetical protein